MIDPVKGYKPPRRPPERRWFSYSRAQMEQLIIWLIIAVVAVVFLAVIWMW
jgi:hypothetical protein